MQGAWRGPWWALWASHATPQTPLPLPTLRERADFPSLVVVASSLGLDPTASAPPRLRGNLPRSRPRRLLRQAPSSRPDVDQNFQSFLAAQPFDAAFHEVLERNRFHPFVQRIIAARHGITPDVDPERVALVVDTVRSYAVT